MLHKVNSLRDFKRKVSPPQPVFMTDDQKSDYLSSLRSDRPARPSGSRPPPFKASTYPSPAKEGPLSRASSTVPTDSSESDTDAHLQISEPSHAQEAHERHERVKSSGPLPASARSRAGLGRPLVSGPAYSNSYSVWGRKISPTAVIQGPAREEAVPYRESGARWMERQEAISLRDALEVMDQKEEEKRIHKAAQDEAADLVWKHQNPVAAEKEKSRPFRNPDLTPNNGLRAHLQKGAHARSQSIAAAELARGIPKADSHRSTSDNSTCSSNGNNNGHTAVHGRSTSASGIRPEDTQDQATTSLPMDSTAIATFPKVPGNRRRSSGQRTLSSGSSKGVFRNPEVQIYEEPKEHPTSSDTSLQIEKAEEELPLKSRHRNSLPRGFRPLPDRASTTLESKRLDRFEIYKNPPTQSRNPAYIANPVTPPPVIEVIHEVDTPVSNGGIEIRSDDIRAATTMRLKDRSPKLPTPTAVSDVPGRPIVSFDKAWKPAEDAPHPHNAVEGKPIRPNPHIQATTVSDSPVPTISLPSEVESTASNANQDALPAPDINLPDETPTPVIAVSGPSALPTIEVAKALPEANARPLPRPSKSSPSSFSPTKSTSRLPWLNPNSRTGVPTATCANCSLPISGRIVTASGSSANSTSQLKAMFHPECFTCHQCSTALECVAFYPEPDNKRRERLEVEGMPPDSETDIRFFCHLDFHEFFSPRCKSCKTPIEGEVIVAAGAEWHVGHFFCAECGDPFDSNTPFVERDGYAYCVRCHTRRTSARCRACKKQILDELTVEALGGKWHEACFVCYECEGGFGEEGRFFVRDVEVECTEKEKRKGMKVKKEEKAVCQACEEKRLKA